MIGHLYYESDDAQRNHLFIEDLQQEAKNIDIDLRLLIDDEQPDPSAQFILFRGRSESRSKQFEEAGYRLFNHPTVNRIANDKLKTYKLAQQLHVPTITTKLLNAAEQIQTYPAVIKTIDGHGGEEVFLTYSMEKTERIMRKFKNRHLIFQPYIESNATDIRVFVLGNDILGAVKRVGNGSFKSNYTLGGAIEQYSLNTGQKNDALTIARALKSDYIGIDFLLLENGQWLLNEIEDPVGARSLYLTHDFSVAARLIGYIKNKLAKSFSVS